MENGVFCFKVTGETVVFSFRGVFEMVIGESKGSGFGDTNAGMKYFLLYARGGRNVANS